MGGIRGRRRRICLIRRRCGRMEGSCRRSRRTLCRSFLSFPSILSLLLALPLLPFLSSSPLSSLLTYCRPRISSLVVVVVACAQSILIVIYLLSPTFRFSYASSPRLFRTLSFLFRFVVAHAGHSLSLFH
jgi:hypothetical protein